MLKEFIAFLRITRAIYKEQRIRCMLYDEQSKMVDLFMKYKDTDFKYPGTVDYMNYLRIRLLEIRKEVENE